MTERLYYTDPYLVEFDAEILAVDRPDARQGVVLDRTAFYPTSGGQPFDTGQLDGIHVLDVVERDDGEILHVLDGELPRGRVTGRIDWPRRFDHMQQHTGQHMLSAAFERVCNARTVSFHLGSEASTIDLATESTREMIARAEDAANQAVWDDRPVTVRFVEANEAARLPLRKEPSRTGRLRIVEIEGCDVSACGGTHVARTGAVGMIAVSAWERFKGGSRIEFRCGGRALRAHRLLRDTVASGARLISAAPEQLADAIGRLQAESRDLRKRGKDLEARLAACQSDALAAAATEARGVRLVLESLPDAGLNELKGIAQSIASRPGYAVILLTASPPVSIVIARSADVAIDAAATLKRVIARFGGRGGGRPDLAQGGGVDATAEAVRAALDGLLAGPGQRVD